MDPQDNDGTPPVKRARRVGPTSRGAASYERKRAVTACQVCRSRRTKCDNKKPKCSFCERTGAECIMAPDDMSTYDPASLRILERLDELQSQLQESFQASVRRASTSQPSVNTLSTLPQGNCSFSRRVDPLLEWSVIKQYSPSLGKVASYLQETPPKTPKSILYNTVDLDTEDCDHLLDDFFHYVHIKNPVLNKEQTRRMVKEVLVQGVGDELNTCLALIICANGAIARSFHAKSLQLEDVEKSLGPVLSSMAQKHLGTVITTSGLVAAQCLFYFGVYRMCTFQPYDAWRMFLQAKASCQRFNFLTGLTHLSTSSEVAHAEECIYWSCWKSERELRWVLQPPDFGELANDHPKSFPSLPDGIYDEEEQISWYFYLSEISLWRLSTRAQRDMESFEHNVGTDYFEGLGDLIEELEDRAEAWTQSLAPTVCLDKSDGTDEGEILRFILRGHINTYYEAIWWPFVNAAVNQGNTSPNVIDYASKGLQNHYNCLRINSQGFNHRHHGTWLLQQSCVRSALVLCAASKVPLTARLLPTGWEFVVNKTILMLHYWRKDNGSTSDRIIELLDHLYPPQNTTDRLFS